ncbi:UvrD-helicase domain-containing protein [Bacillus sanguinis]
MKVEEQIKWNERLWVERSWGSQTDKNSGIYSFICSHYNIPFHRYGWGVTFELVCRKALENLNQLEQDGSFEPFFDYILIDESQDFNESFFQLCEKVTKKQVYIAGDIFQSIYDYNKITENKPDFLLNRVYRTDPKTLMFAHAVGFGVLERPVVRWLSDEEWEACGYAIEKDGDYYSFSREPLRRFDNVHDNITSLKLSIAEDNKYLDKVISSIKDIQEKNPTVKPGDIGVVFLENKNSNYDLAEELIIKIDQMFGWSAIKGYEVKNKEKDSLFISNRNNIKGLEFPFIICITTTPLNTNTSIRNSLYMMLTRSFLTSYLILSEDNGDLNTKLEETVEEIINTGVLKVKKPQSFEIMDKSKLMLEANGNKSQYDIVEEILRELEIEDYKTKQKSSSSS